MTTVPGLDLIRDGTWSIGVPIPHEHMPYTLTYLLRDAEGRIHLIDPGWASDENERMVLDAVEATGGATSALASIIVTHQHPDHIGLAERLRDLSGAAIVMHRAEAAAMVTVAAEDHGERATQDRLDRWGVPADRRAEVVALQGALVPQPVLAPDLLVDDGDLLPVPGRELRVLHTPGHTPGHICVRDVGERMLFTGDHLLPRMFPGLGLGGASETNPLSDYLASLDRIAGLDDHEACPGHWRRFHGIAARCAETAAHHGRRLDEVASALDRDPGASAWQIARQLTWTSGWENLRGFYLVSALAQTAMHAEVARARRT